MSSAELLILSKLDIFGTLIIMCGPVNVPRKEVGHSFTSEKIELHLRVSHVLICINSTVHAGPCLKNIDRLFDVSVQRGHVKSYPPLSFFLRNQLSESIHNESLVINCFCPALNFSSGHLSRPNSLTRVLLLKRHLSNNSRVWCMFDEVSTKVHYFTCMDC